MENQNNKEKESEISEQSGWRTEAGIDRELAKLPMFELRLEADLIMACISFNV